MFIVQGIAALAAKIAGASTIAQAAAGLGITVAGVTGAGAAGALPGPVQDSVAHVIEVVTPFSVPHSSPVRTHASDDAPATPAGTTVLVPTTAPVSTEPVEAPKTTDAPETTAAAETTSDDEATHHAAEKTEKSAKATTHKSDGAQETGENESADEQHHGGTGTEHDAEHSTAAPTSAAPRTGEDSSGHHSGSDSGSGSHSGSGSGSHDG